MKATAWVQGTDEAADAAVEGEEQAEGAAAAGVLPGDSEDLQKEPEAEPEEPAKPSKSKQVAGQKRKAPAASKVRV